VVENFNLDTDLNNYENFQRTVQAIADKDANNARVTFEAGAKVTLVVVDKDGREVLSEQVSTATVTSTSGDPLSAELRSPYAKNYKYFETLAEAQDNSGTALDETGILAKVDGTVYVGYDINAANGETILYTDGTAYRIRRNTSNTQGMHATFQPSKANDSNNNYGWKMEYQSKDYDDNSSNDVNYNTLPFIDRSWAWEFVNSHGDPYSVKIRNKATGQYLRCENSSNKSYQAMFTDSESEAALYSLLQYGSGTNYLVIYVTDNTVSQTGYLYYNANADGGVWRLRSTRTSSNGSNDGLSNIRVEELTTPLDIHIVAPANAPNAGEVEATLHGYRNSGVGATTMPSFVPYFLTRAYTSDQKFYYTKALAAAAAADTEIASGATVDDESITDSYGSDGVKDIFVSYTLDAANWIPSGTALTDAAKTANTTIIKPFHSSEKKINWYGIRANQDNSDFLKADGTLPAVITRTSLDTSAPDTEAMKRSEWAIFGTPYSLQLVERYHGTAYHLGMADDATSGTRAYVYSSGTTDVVTTFELVTGLSGTTGKLFLRPQGALNAQAPTLYIGGNDNNMPVSRAAGSAQIIDLTWIKETDAKTLTFTLCDRDGSSMSSIVDDYTFTGVAEGDNIADLFNTTGMKRRYCEYAYYSNATLTTSVSAVGSVDDETVYVQWQYTDDAPVFSTGSETRDYQYYMISVHNGSYDFMMNVTGNSTDGYTLAPVSSHTTLKEGHTQFALVGNPYAFTLYSRYAERNLKTNSTGAGLTFLAEDNGVATTDAVFDLPIPVNASITQSTRMDIRMKAHPEKHIWGTASEFWMANSTGGYAQLMYMVVPVRVFEEGSTALANIKDHQEYALDLNPSGTARTTDVRMTDGDLYPSPLSGNANYYTHDFRHAFCDYTFYRNYDWSTGVLSNDIPDEGLPYYGGKEQAVCRFFATYTVDEVQFSRIYLLSNPTGASYRQFFGKGDMTTDENGLYYDITSVQTEDAARSDAAFTYRWQMTGDPYNLQLTSLATGDGYLDIPLGATAKSANTPTKANGELMMLSNNTAYTTYSHWEIILNNDGNHVFYLVDDVTTYDDDDRYTYSLGTHTYNKSWLVAMSGSNGLLLTPAIPQYNITWNVVDNTTHEIVATETIANVDESTVLTLGDLPESLVRHFCEYSSMYDGSGTGVGTTATLGSLLESYTVTAAKSLYVPYTLSSDAPEFWTGDGLPSTDATDYWYEMHYTNEDRYLYNNSGAIGSSLELYNPISELRENTINYSKYRWLLIGTPYNVKFYNMDASKYLSTDGVNGTAATLTSGDGTTFEMLSDPAGQFCAIHDAVSGMYINQRGSSQSYNSAWTSVEFTNTNGIVKLTLVLHYSGNTLRLSDSDSDKIPDESLAGETEVIEIENYQKKGKSLDDVLPDEWKRAFCKYTYYWNSSLTTSSTSAQYLAAPEVTTISYEGEGNMLDWFNTGYKAQTGNDPTVTTIAIHVTYDYETNSPFKWSTNTTSSEGKYWYYWVNHHIQGTSKGKMTYTSGENSFRMTADLLSDDFYTNNYEWCVIGDPYGFRMLCYYDPDQKYNEYVRVSDTYHTYKTSNKLVNRDVEGSGTQNLFEMRLSHANWSKYFWMHPIYTTDLMDESDDMGGYSYVCADGLASSHPLLATGGQSSKVKSNSIANFTLMPITAPEMEEYLYYKGFVNGLSNDKVDSDTETFTIGGETGLTLKDIYDKVKERRASVTDYSTYTHYITDEVADYIHSLLFGTGGQVQMTEGYYRIIPYTYERYESIGAGETGGRHYIRGYHYGSGTNGYTNSGATSTGWSDRQEYDGSSATRTLMLNETEGAAAYDPASIFHFKATTVDGHPRYKISTQGMWLSGSDGAPKLYASEGSAYDSRVENIGSVIAQVKLAGSNTNGYNYLSYVQNFNSNEPVDARRSALRQSFTAFNYSRFYLQPVGSEGDNLKSLRLEMYPGTYTPEGQTEVQNYYFSTLYVPFDVVLPADKNVFAYRGKMTKDKDYGTSVDAGEHDWRLQCEKLSARTVGGVTYEAGKFIPAGTPVLIRVDATDGTDGSVSELVSDYDRDHANSTPHFTTLTIPNDAPATSLTPDATFFHGQYLEQILPESVLAGGTSRKIYVFGQSTGDDYATKTTADKPATVDEVGFYINKNTVDGTATYANKNNLYVRHNKIYLIEEDARSRYTQTSASARQFIPLDFDDLGIEEQPSGWHPAVHEGVFDLQGRRVATAGQAADGSWRQSVKRGVYIVNGRKEYVE